MDRDTEIENEVKKILLEVVDEIDLVCPLPPGYVRRGLSIMPPILPLYTGEVFFKRVSTPLVEHPFFEFVRGKK